MPKSRIAEVVEQLHQAVLRKDGAGLTDGRLLEIFINRNDHAAFEALVRRHGAMVWGVCRRVLGNSHDADDAFQASFLVLLRKAVSVMPREMVGNWLYGVAYQTALKAKAVAAGRKVRESQVKKMPEIAVEQREAWNDVQPLLDQELTYLPAKYRAVILLCDLEGKSRKEAARQLGCPEGTIAGRLARARILLARRLKRHGYPLSGGVLAALLSEKAASAYVPTTVLISTIKAAKVLLAGETAATGFVSVTVTALMEGVMKAMFLTKLKTVMTVVLMVGVLCLGGGLVTHATIAGQEGKTDTFGRASGTSQVSEKAPKTDLDRLQGVWSVVSLKGGSNVTPPQQAVFIVDGKRACWQMSDDDDFQGGLYLDTTATPKSYDFASHRATVEGIYALDGDMLRLCYELGTDSFWTGAKRPTRFAASDKQVLVVLKRLFGPEVLDYRLADGTKAFPRFVENSAKNSGPQPPPAHVDDPLPPTPPPPPPTIDEPPSPPPSIPVPPGISDKPSPPPPSAFERLREQNRLLRDMVKSLDHKQDRLFDESREGKETAYLVSETKQFKLPAVSLGQPIERLSLLVSSDGGKSWKLAAEKISPPTPSRQHFSYTAPSDGVYWFHFAVVGKDRTVYKIRQESSPLKILVDTSEHAPIPRP